MQQIPLFEPYQVISCSNDYHGSTKDNYKQDRGICCICPLWTNSMIAQLLKKAFDLYHNFPMEVWESLAESGNVIHSQKEQILKKSDSTEKFLNLIIKGSGGIILWNKTISFVRICCLMAIFSATEIFLLC